MNVIGSLCWTGKIAVGIGRMICNPYLIPKGEGEEGKERDNISKPSQHLLFITSVSLWTFMTRKM